MWLAGRFQLFNTFAPLPYARTRHAEHAFAFCAWAKVNARNTITTTTSSVFTLTPIDHNYIDTRSDWQHSTHNPKTISDFFAFRRIAIALTAIIGVHKIWIFKSIRVYRARMTDGDDSNIIVTFYAIHSWQQQRWPINWNTRVIYDAISRFPFLFLLIVDRTTKSCWSIIKTNERMAKIRLHTDNDSPEKSSSSKKSRSCIVCRRDRHQVAHIWVRMLSHWETARTSEWEIINWNLKWEIS